MDSWEGGQVESAKIMRMFYAPSVQQFILPWVATLYHDNTGGVWLCGTPDRIQIGWDKNLRGWGSEAQLLILERRGREYFLLHVSDAGGTPCWGLRASPPTPVLQFHPALRAPTLSFKCNRQTKGHLIRLSSCAVLTQKVFGNIICIQTGSWASAKMANNISQCSPSLPS